MSFLLDYYYGVIEEFSSHPVLLRTLVAALLVSVTCSLLSVYVVLKKLAFIGQGISHSAFGGIAFGLWMFPALAAPDLKVYLITVGFCIAVAFCIAYTSRAKILSEDSAIGVFFVTGMALGTVFLALRNTYTADITSYLFGKVIAVTPDDIRYLLVLLGAVALVFFIYFRDFYSYCFDVEFSDVIGLPSAFLHYLLLFLLTVTIVFSVKVVGIVLVTAFLVIPASCALQMTGRIKMMVFWSLVTGAVSSVGGVMISNQSDLPVGSMIVILQFGFFILLTVYHRVRRWFSANL